MVITALQQKNEIQTEQDDLKNLYVHTFPDVARLVSRLGGNLEEAKDIFHDALVIFLEKEPVSFTMSKEAYIVGIAKHL